MKVRNFDSELPATLGGTGSLVSGNSLVNLYRDTVTSLTNRSGSVRYAGDVVIVDTAADSSFTISASCNTLLPVGVLLEDTAVGSNGRVRFGGLAESVSVGSNVTATRGSFLYHSSTPTRANPMFGTAPSAGAFGYVVAQGSNTAPKALIFPTYDGAGGAASLSYGSNATRVREVSTAGVATEVARHDHAHDGIATITASSSNTMQRGTWNLRPGAGIALNLSDTDGDGEFDTTTIVNTGSGGGGGGGTSGYDLDSYTIDSTYGDDFTGAALSGIWTRRNFTSGAETYQLGKNATYMRIALTGRAVGDGYFQTAPGGDWTFAMAFTVHYGTQAEMWGLACIDTNGTGVAAGFYNNPNTLLVIDVTTYSTYGGAFSQETAFSAASPWTTVAKRWIYLRKSGTNYYAAHSFDGEVWSPETAANASSHTVDRVGFMYAPLSGLATTAVIDMDWFNKIA